MEVLKRPSKSDIANVIFELMNSVTRVHMNHLLTNSYAAHKAMNEFYDSIGGLADDIAEQYQGATEQLLNFPTSAIMPVMRTPSDCITYLRELYVIVDACHNHCTYSEIQNVLDEVKSLINSTKYKLIFLK